MLRFIWDTDRGPVQLVCISEPNVLRLKAGQPLKLAAADEFRQPHDIVVAYGPTLVDVVDDFEREAGVKLPPEVRRSAQSVDDAAAQKGGGG